MFGLFKKRTIQSQLETTPDPSQIVPRIKNSSFIPSLINMGMPQDQLPITQPLVADLLVTYAFDLPDMFKMVAQQDLDHFGLNEKSLHILALQNMKRQVSKVSLHKHNDELFQIEIGNDMEACTILFPSLWSRYAAKMKGKLVATVAHRSLVLFCDGTSKENVQTMRLFAKTVHDEAEDNHTLSLSLIEWSDGWKEYKE